MKKIKVIALTIAFSVLTVVTSFAAVYPKTAIITEINEDVVTCDDGINLWDFECREDYFIGDVVSMIMSDNDTSQNIYDDEILECRYSCLELK